MTKSEKLLKEAGKPGYGVPNAIGAAAGIVDALRKQNLHPSDVAKGSESNSEEAFFYIDMEENLYQVRVSVQ